MSDTDEDNSIYASIWEEIETQKTDKGIWAKAFSLSGGSEEKVKALYIGLRMEQLKTENEIVKGEVAPKVEEEEEQNAEECVEHKKIEEQPTVGDSLADLEVEPRPRGVSLASAGKLFVWAFIAGSAAKIFRFMEGEGAVYGGILLVVVAGVLLILSLVQSVRYLVEWLKGRM